MTSGNPVARGIGRNEGTGLQEVLGGVQAIARGSERFLGREERRGRGVSQQHLTWVILHKAFVEVGQLIGGDVTAGVIGRLEVQVVLAVPVELGGGHVHTDDDLIRVACLADGVPQQLKS